MGARFLVTGLPRSRTAWMAALLTAHGFPCLHEPEITLGPITEIRRIFDLGWRGISDPACYLKWPDQIERDFIGRPCLVVERNPDEAKASFECYVGEPVKNWGAFTGSLAIFRGKFDPLVIDFRDMDNADTMDMAVKHLTGSPLNRRTFSLFRDLRIEQHLDKAKAALACE